MQPAHPILAIDYGKTRVGLAATDELAISIHPITTAPTSQALTQIQHLTHVRRVKTLLLGLPLRLDGSEGDSAKAVRKFGEELTKALPELPLIYHDETFSTLTASEKLRTLGKTAKKQKGIIDQAAAMEILRDFLAW